MRKKYIVVGAGVAGMYFSLKAAKHADITIICKNGLHDSNTFMAQGGIAAALSDEDSTASHIRDTMVAGDGLCDEKVVNFILARAPLCIRNLAGNGLAFDRNPGGNYKFALEGGHSHPRIVHVRDRTGENLLDMLIHQVKQHPRIKIISGQQAIDLYTEGERCHGVYIGDKSTGDVRLEVADATILACGGVGSIYKVHTNTPLAEGDGIAMAHRAGVQMENMEFVQFHPTFFYDPEGPGFLISEAVRGFGAELKIPDGTTFMEHYHNLGSLAPRDTVSRAIHTEMKNHKLTHVGLDLRGFDPLAVKKRFPFIIDQCEKAGVDITREMIPVVPAAHYLCGGIQTNCSGQTSLAGLLALGENACTGLHGANRLASNSLLEALVTAAEAADTLEGMEARMYPGIHSADNFCICRDEKITDLKLPQKDEIRELMWTAVGIVRSGDQLRHASASLTQMEEILRKAVSVKGVSVSVVERMNMIQTARLIADAAEKRKESRGVHLRSDFPFKSGRAVHSVSLGANPSPLIKQPEKVC